MRTAVERRLVTGLTGGLLLAGAATAAAAPVLARAEIDGAIVRFHLSEPVIARAVMLPDRVDGRSRVAVDFPGTALGPRARQPMAGDGIVVQLRAEEQGEASVRVTIELSDSVGFVVGSAGNVVIVTFQDPAAGTAPPPPTTPGVSQPPVAPGT